MRNRARRTRTPTRRLPAVRLLVAFAATGLVAACAGADGPVVNVYSHRHYDTDQELFDRFTETTGIQVRVVSASADELIQRLEREGAASPADVLITVDAGRLHRAKTRDLLQPVRSEELETVVPAHLRDPEGYWFGLTTRARILAYAKDRVDPAELSTYEALVEPGWEDRLLVRSSENIYNVSLLASIIAAHGSDEAARWAEGVVANLARPPRGNDTDQIRDAAAGVGDVALVNTYYVGRLLGSDDPRSRELAEQVGVFFPNQGEDERGTHVNVSGAAVTTHAPNPDHGVRLIEFLVSEEAQERFAEANYEYPVREGVPWAQALEEWGEFRADTLNLEMLGELNNEAVTTFDRAGWP